MAVLCRKRYILKRSVHSFNLLEKDCFLRDRFLTGFTLIELVTVIIIIGILASLGMPMYTKAMEGSRNKEAKSQLGLIAEAERMHWLEQRNYTTCSDISDCNDKLYLSLPQDSSWDYSARASASAFTAQAVRKKADKRIWTINENLNISCNNAKYCPY